MGVVVLWVWWYNGGLDIVINWCGGFCGCGSKRCSGILHMKCFVVEGDEVK